MSAPSLLLALALIPVAASGSGAHEHGVSRLDIAIEGDQISIALDGAGHNFVGFEREPQSAEESAAIVQALERLSQPASLFGIPPQARCAALDVDYQGLPSAHRSAAGADAPDHHHAHTHAHDHGHGHGHDDSDSHDQASDAPGRSHGNWRISYRMQCDHPAALRSLEPRLFEAFQNTTELRWQLISGSHQDGGSLSAPGGRIGLLPAR